MWTGYVAYGYYSMAAIGCQSVERYNPRQMSLVHKEAGDPPPAGLFTKPSSDFSLHRPKSSRRH